MYPITNAVKALYEAEKKQVLRITGTDRNNRSISITEANVMMDGFNIDRFSCNGQILEVGTAVSSEMKLKLDNRQGMYNDIVFEGAELFVEMGIADWSQSSPTINWMPCGYYTPDVQPRRLDTISITALDRMMWFENVKVLLQPWTTQSGEVVRNSAGEPIYFVANTSLVFPCTVAQLVTRVCSLCGVPFTQSLSSLPNYNYSITQLLVTDLNISFRNIIQWCAGIMGTNAWIDWNGRLRFSWYDNDASYVSTTENRFSSDLYENAIVITGVKYTYTDDQQTEYIAGTGNYAIDLTGNGLINSDNAPTILQNIYYAINAFAYTPFSASVVTAPYLWPMDRIVFTDKNGNGHVSVLTNVNISLNGETAISAVGESTKAYSYGSTGSFSIKQRAELQKWHSNVVADTMEAVDNASAQITGANGGYVRFMYDANGIMTEILIMNTPDIATATKVWRWNSGGFGYSSNGYQGPFTTAITQDGAIVADFITTGVLNADLVTTGTMLANRIFGGTLTLGGSNNNNGTLIVKDTSGNIIGTWDNTGLVLNKGSIVGPSITLGGNSNTYGSLQILDYNGDVIGKWGQNGIEISRGDINLQYSSNTSIHISNTATPLVINTDSSVWEFGSLWSKLSGNGSSIDFKPRSIRIDIANNAAYTTDGLTINNGYYGTYTYNNGQHILVYFDINTYTEISPNQIYSKGDLYVSGTKSRVVSTDQYSDRLLYCYETPSPLFGDVGEGVIGEDGYCYVMLDAVFARTISTDNYQVFLQRYGSGDCWVRERKPGWFVVEGEPGLSFGWEIKAKQRDFDQLRLERNDEKFTVPTQNYGAEAAQHISDIMKERVSA